MYWCDEDKQPNKKVKDSHNEGDKGLTDLILFKVNKYEQAKTTFDLFCC
jgi:hypothetical protein